jgi:5-hydroxyisourate hydrolase-like protein (transthyretin family)
VTPPAPRSTFPRFLLAALALVAFALLLWWLPSAPRDAVPEEQQGAAAAVPAAASGARAPAALPPMERSAQSAAPAAAKSGPDRPAGGALEGRVLSSATGRPIAGAELTFQRDDGASTVRSDVDGSYRFAPEGPGHYRLAAAEADGFLPFAPAWGRSPLHATLLAGVVLRGIDIKLVPATDYRVLVVDADEQPVEGALVQLRAVRESGLALLPPAPARSGPDGVAILRLPEEAWVDASKGSATGSAYLWLQERLSRRVKVTLVATAPPRPPTPGARPLAGRVVDARTGAGVEGARVELREELHGAEQGKMSPGSATSGADGAFTIAEGFPVPLLATAEASGYQRLTDFKVAAGVEPVLPLVPFDCRLAGRVTDARSGAPVMSFVVSLRRPAGPLQTQLEVTRAFIDGDGRYELAQLQPGAAVVVIAADGYAPSEAAVTLASGLGKVDAALRAGASVSGTVLDAKTKAPLAGARLEVEGARAEGQAPVRRVGAQTDDAGRFTLLGLGDEPMSLVVSAEGHHARILALQGLPREGSGPEQQVLLTPLGEGEEPKLELTGIGAALEPRGDELEITALLPGGAAQAGLLRRDRVLAIDGRPVQELGFEGAMSAIRGPEGSTVVLKVRRAAAAPADVRVTRTAIRG